jgi:hypothetical protein
VEEQTMNSIDLWKEYDELCELAEAAGQHDPMASATWEPRLREARETAVLVERLEFQEKNVLAGHVYDYPMVSADVADSLIERGGR